jgi:hypothetical protein
MVHEHSVVEYASCVEYFNMENGIIKSWLLIAGVKYSSCNTHGAQDLWVDQHIVYKLPSL